MQRTSQWIVKVDGEVVDEGLLRSQAHTRVDELVAEFEYDQITLLQTDNTPTYLRYATAERGHWVSAQQIKSS